MLVFLSAGLYCPTQKKNRTITFLSSDKLKECSSGTQLTCEHVI